MSQYDLIVIGSGPAGAKGAEEAARLGKTVALVERAPRLGGAGIATGTVPSKTLREMAQYLAGLRQRGGYGLEFTLRPELTLGDLMYRRQMVLEAEWGVIQRSLDRYRIEVVRGEAALRGPHQVRVRAGDGRTLDLNATVILLATGSHPYHPPQIPMDDPRLFDSHSLPAMGRLPRSVVVVGGGVVGAEYAAMFAALGAAVTLVELQGRLLPPVDGELAERFKRHLEEQGVRVILNEPVVGVDKRHPRLILQLQNGEALECEAALVAAGRQGNTHGLGLEAAGVAVDEQGYIRVNDRLQTSVPSIYAAGDVATRHCFAPISMEQGRQAALNALGADAPTRPALIPQAVYTIPEIALVGLTEEQCKAQGRPYLVGRAYADQNPRGRITGDTSGLLKLI
ncbi:MAG: FAD-dependent oxidoreductase, partial [Anaerolineales bacterium]|nr:FAD-dependent oxidoreductase [Anaerolineales bacterium]